MSGIVRFISDPHFFHRNMAIKRGFKDEHQMNEHIVAQWNKVVKKGDTTWILGDITMEKNQYEILSRLNGMKRVVLGNHDSGNHAKHMLPFVLSIHGMAKFKDKVYGAVWLTHCPVHPGELEFRCAFNIHGHVHENSVKDKRYINVCMEVQNYTPKTIEELIKK